MVSGFINPKIFGERLAYLMKKDGIDPLEKSAESILSTKMYGKGIIEYNDQTGDEAAKAKQRDNTRRRISEHLKLDVANKLSGEWLQRYCDYFKCSADYLLGYIDLPTHTTTNIANATGLSDRAVERIISKNGNIPNQDFLNSFILSDEFLEIQHNMYWIENDCNNILSYYKAFEEIHSSIEKVMDKDECNRLDDMRDRYANKLEHNGNQIQYLMYQCSLSFGNFMNKVKKTWNKEVKFVLESMGNPMPGFEKPKDD